MVSAGRVAARARAAVRSSIVVGKDMPAVYANRAAPPPFAGDPWAWVVLLGVLPLVLRSLGAPLGEPIADDFDYLYRALLTHERGFFDGFGSILYWRPVGRQVYYLLLSPLIVAAPWIVPTLHAVLLGLAGLLIYRALRSQWSGPAAAVAATFPMLAESTRMLLAWSSHFQDLGAILFAAVALHETARRRLGTALLAMLASLLCKELAAPVALLLPWLPAAPLSRRERLRWSAAMAVLVLAWAAVYLVVARSAGLTTHHRYVSESANAIPIVARYAWAVWQSLRAAFSLAANPGPRDGMVGIALGAAAVFAIARFALVPQARRKMMSALGWFGWGLAWFLLAAVTMVEVYPDWAPYRSVFGAVGLGIAIAALAAAAHPWLPALVVALRVAALGLSPGPPRDVHIAPEESGAVFDFSRLVRLERIVSETRHLLQRELPTLAPGSAVVIENLPRQAEYAYAGSRALRVWYRDTTLRLVRIGEFQRDPGMRAATVIEYTLEPGRPLALVDPAAMRSILAALAHASGGRWHAALAEVDRADSLQPHERARVFEGTLASTRSVAAMSLGDSATAQRLARRSLAISRWNRQARWVLIRVGLGQNRLAEVEAQLDTLVRLFPEDAAGRNLRDRLRAGRDRTLR